MSEKEKEYDVALSFAGEDRAYVEKVANSLKEMGVKVFYDSYETVSLWGKNLYSHLQDIYSNKARYTVMFLSKHYKEKLWTNLERESAQARAFKEKEEYILPARFDNTDIPGILPTVGYIDLSKHSPVQFATLINKKLGNVLSSPHPSVQTSIAQEFDPNSLVLLLSPDGRPQFIQSIRFESGDLIRISLSPVNPKQASFLTDLRNSGNNPIGLAHGLTAQFTKVSSVSQIVREAKEVWIIELRPMQANYQGSALGELRFGSISADEIAEMRARRILLNENHLKSSPTEQMDVNSINDMMLEAFVQGINAPIKIEESPFPALYKLAKDSPAEFYAAARLFAVLRLVLSGTVEYIFQLDLDLASEDVLNVKFEGQRARQYSNVPPHIIKFEGQCSLIEAEGAPNRV